MDVDVLETSFFVLMLDGLKLIASLIILSPLEKSLLVSLAPLPLPNSAAALSPAFTDCITSYSVIAPLITYTSPFIPSGICTKVFT